MSSKSTGAEVSLASSGAAGARDVLTIESLERWPLSYPKIPSGMDWHHKAESLHR
jgi:hypothetical protein